VEYTGHSNDQMKTLKASLTSSTSETTEWILGITSPIVSNDILKEMRYPDASSGASSSSEKDQYTYNQLNQIITFTDRNGNVHTYGYDILGRPISDAVTTLGSGVDGTVRRIETAYDTQGNAYLFTSYDAASGGSIVNQVQREFNGLCQLITEWQAVGGAVNTSTSPKVQYAYSFAPSGSTNHSRLTSITYPNGRVITFNYATGLNDNISRLSSITDGGTTLESYEYVGYGMIVKRGHPESGVDLTYIKQSGESDGSAGDKYNGLDLFGRIIDQRWTTSTPTAKDRWQYGYDRNSNPLYKENLIDSTRSEFFDYDGLNQLTSFSRGTLNGGKTAISGAASRSQAWDFDGLGNFESQTTNGTAQTRTHNKQNELLTATSQTSPTYDSNGNQTKDFADLGYGYDAWNRLIEVTHSGGGSAVRNYEYDALGRRIQVTTGGTTTDFYYSIAGQVLEERVSGTAIKSYVWSPVYVDAMIARDRDTDANGSLDERLYVMHDANFNVTGLVNTSGTVMERYAYDPFGLPTYFDASYGTRGSSSYGWNYLHQGLSWDGGIGKYNNRAREYDPVQGRFTSVDPLLFGAGDVNFYRLEGNGPANSLDPLGLRTIVVPYPPGQTHLDFEYRLSDIPKNLLNGTGTAINCKCNGLVGGTSDGNLALHYDMCGLRESLHRAFKEHFDLLVALGKHHNKGGKIDMSMPIATAMLPLIALPGVGKRYQEMLDTITAIFQGHDRDFTLQDLMSLVLSIDSMYKAFSTKSPKVVYDHDEIGACRAKGRGPFNVRVGWKYFDCNPAERQGILLHEFMHYFQYREDEGYYNGVPAACAQNNFTPSKLVLTHKDDSTKVITCTTDKRINNADSYFAWYYLLYR